EAVRVAARPGAPVGLRRRKEVRVGADAERLLERLGGTVAEVGRAVADAEQRRRVEPVAPEGGDDGEGRRDRIDRADGAVTQLEWVGRGEGPDLVLDAQPLRGPDGSRDFTGAPEACRGVEAVEEHGERIGDVDDAGIR